MNCGALSDWQMIFRKCSAETTQHLVFETLRRKKDLKMKAGEKKIPISENLERSVATLYPHLHCNGAGWRFSYYHCSRRKKNIRYSAMECLCNIFGSTAAQQWSHDHSSRLCWDTTAGLYFIFLERTTGMWCLMSFERRKGVGRIWKMSELRHKCALGDIPKCGVQGLNNCMMGCEKISWHGKKKSSA